MCSRVLAFFFSLVLLASSVMASAPASAAPDQHPLAVLAAVDQGCGDMPAPESAAHEAAETLLDVPDQLEGPCASHDRPPRARRLTPQTVASLTHPHLEGPQRPPRHSA